MGQKVFPFAFFFSSGLMKKLMIIIYGPTGVGKSDLALKLANYLSAEIVNIDVGQFYTPLSIGTAKPDWKNAPIPHHLFDIINKPVNFTVTAYRSLLLKTLNSLWQHNHLPVVTGGSGFYLRSIFFPPQEGSSSTKKVPTYPSDENLWKLLAEIDPARAQEIDPKDIYRIKRALDIWYSTGVKPSEYKPVYDPPASFILICLLRERKELYKRINERVVTMIEGGWIEEVKQLIGTPWEPFIREKKIIGYNEILSYLEEKKTNKSLERLIVRIQQRTRHYAKRQITFWRTFEYELKKAMKEKTRFK